MGVYDTVPPTNRIEGPLHMVPAGRLREGPLQQLPSDAILLVVGGEIDIPSLITVLRKPPTAVVFQEGGAFYHAAIYLSAEGIPCAVRPDSDLSDFEGQIVGLDLQDACLLTEADVPASGGGATSPITTPFLTPASMPPPSTSTPALAVLTTFAILQN